MTDKAAATGTKLFFIVGRGRSGTTLLCRYLDAQVGMGVAPESMFVLNLEGRYGSRHFAAADIDAFCCDLFRDERILNWAFGRDELQAFLQSHIQPGALYADVCRLVYTAQARFTGKLEACLLGDKNPHYSLFVPRLARLFPEARFIHLVRDPRANVSSYLQVPFDSAFVGTLAGRWRLYNEAILDALGQLKGRYLCLRFEDFVNGPEPAVQGILGFLGATQSGATAIAATEHQKKLPWHQRLSADMDPSILERWRQRLSSRQVAQIERMDHALMLEFGYPAESHGFPSVLTWFDWLNAYRTVLQERLLFWMPFYLRNTIITLYRRMTGTV